MLHIQQAATTARAGQASRAPAVGRRVRAVHVLAWQQHEAGKDSKQQQQQQNPPPSTQAMQREVPRVLQASLDAMLQRYYAKAPTAAAVIQRLYAQPGGYGLDQVAHDHFAFRTFGVPGLGIQPLGAALEGLGYSQRDFYTFPRTHLLATWYAPPRELYGRLPRVFVSQLQVDKLSPGAQAIIHSYTNEAAANRAGGDSSSSSGAAAAAGAAAGAQHGDALAAWSAAVTGVLPWRVPTRADYLSLLGESEYGAWVLANGYALNHTALRVHGIAGRQGRDIHGYADELAAAGFRLNDEGGVMKVSPDGGLLQCSTVADVLDFTFADGAAHPVVGAYLEFAERKAAPEHAHVPPAQLREEQRRDGFEAASAANIFASTTLAARGISA